MVSPFVSVAPFLLFNRCLRPPRYLREGAALQRVVCGTLAAVLSLASSGGVSAQSASRAEREAQAYFGEIEMVNQDGRAMRLYSDLLRGKTVVIHSFFASCTASCPVVASRLEALQQGFADRLEKDLRLISISLDPEHDTPSRLKSHADRLGAQPGWYFLTGRAEDVEQALRKLGQFTEDKNAHLNVLIVGNLRTGLWKKAVASAAASDLSTIVTSVLDDPGAEGTEGTEGTVLTGETEKRRRTERP